MGRLPHVAALALAALAVAVVNAPAVAQVQAVQAPLVGRSLDPMTLMRMEQVQEELQLVDEQKAKLKEVGEELRRQTRQQWSVLRDLSPDQRKAKYAELRQKAAARAAEARKKVREILLPHQVKRLEQIAMQLRMRWRGLSGIAGDPALAEQLGLSPEQKEKLKKIAEETRQKLQEAPRQIMEEAKKQAVEVLTPEQKKKLEEATGEEFELKWSRPTAINPGGPMRVRKIEAGRP